MIDKQNAPDKIFIDEDWSDHESLNFHYLGDIDKSSTSYIRADLVQKVFDDLKNV